MAAQQPTPPPFVNVTKDYENNPFFVATQGISLVFKLAKSVAIFAIVISVLATFAQFPQSNNEDTTIKQADTIAHLSSLTAEQIALYAGIGLVILLAITAISIMISGITAYTAAQVSKGEQVTLREAFNAVLGRFGGYTWVYFLVSIKTFLWTLLFVIPGVIKGVQYSLATTTFFDTSKNLKGDATLKESMRLVKGAWLTTFASQILLNIATLGFISTFVSTGVQAQLYKQYDAASKTNSTKPKAHWLSWVTLFIPVLLGLFFVFLLAALMYMFSNSDTTF